MTFNEINVVKTSKGYKFFDQISIASKPIKQNNSYNSRLVKHKIDGLFIELNSSINFDTYYVKTDSFVSLRVLHFKSPYSISKPPIIFIAGWISTIYSWRHFIPYITLDYEFIYIETREKKSSLLSSKDVSFKMEEYVNDIKKVILDLKLKDNSYYLAGSSLGATSILLGTSQNLLKPKGVYAILPNRRFKVPLLIFLNKIVPERYLKHLKVFYKNLILKFRLGKLDKSQIDKFNYALENADLKKLKKSVVDFDPFYLSDDNLVNIRVPTMIIGASKDKMHNQNEILEIYSLIDDSTFEDTLTSSKSRVSNTAKSLSAFINSIERDKRLS